MGRIRTKRVYEPASPDDGYRVLVDRLWPRGRTRESLSLDLWAKDVAPSGALRTFLHEDRNRYGAFAERYRKELGSSARALEALTALKARLALGDLTLLTAAREEPNHATVLAGYLDPGVPDGDERDRRPTEGRD